MAATGLGTALGIIRTGVGASLVAAPAWAGRVWVGPDADGPGTRVFARALGARDVALGSALLAASAAGEERTARGLLRLGVLADLADVTATLVAYRHLEGNRRVVMPAVAAAVGALGLAAWRATSAEPPGDASTAEEEGIVDQQGAVLDELADGVAASRT